MSEQQCIFSTAIIYTLDVDCFLDPEIWKGLNAGPCNRGADGSSSSATADLRWSRGGGWGGEGGEVGEGELHLICCAFVARAERVNRTCSSILHDWPSTQSDQLLEFMKWNTFILKWIQNRIVLICVVLLLIIYLKVQLSKLYSSHRDTCKFLVNSFCSYMIEINATLLVLLWSWSCRRLVPLPQVNTMLMMLKTSCSGSTSRCLS